MKTPQWSPLPDGAARPPQTSAARSARRMTLAASALLVLCLAWAAWVSLRPLEQPTLAMTEPPPVLEPITLAQQSIDSRQRTLAHLSSSNMFSAERMWWTPGGAVGIAQQPSESQEQNGEIVSTDPLPQAGETITVVENDEDLPRDLQQAIKNVDLMGVYRSRDGEPVAMVRFVRDATMRTQRATPGDTITSLKDENDSWLVLALEEQPTSIILRRDGTNVRVPLRDGISGLFARASSGDAPPAVADAEARVEERTEADVRIELLLAGYDEEEIEELLALARGEELEASEPEAPPVVAQTQQAASALREAVTNSGADGADTGAGSDMPPGLAALFEMMASGETPSEEAFRAIEERKRLEAQGAQQGGEPGSPAPDDG
ncbi:MAG: hypothetical protein AAGD00_01115 [Planctomycetota bacterium]